MLVSSGLAVILIYLQFDNFNCIRRKTKYFLLFSITNNFSCLYFWNRSERRPLFPSWFLCFLLFLSLLRILDVYVKDIHSVEFSRTHLISRNNVPLIFSLFFIGFFQVLSYFWGVEREWKFVLCLQRKDQVLVNPERKKLSIMLSHFNWYATEAMFFFLRKHHLNWMAKKNRLEVELNCT